MDAAGAADDGGGGGIIDPRQEINSQAGRLDSACPGLRIQWM